MKENMTTEVPTARAEFREVTLKWALAAWSLGVILEGIGRLAEEDNLKDTCVFDLIVRHVRDHAREIQDFHETFVSRIPETEEDTL